jgi:hypothetical protein
MAMIIALYLGPVAVAGLFDRYLLPLLPPAMALTAVPAAGLPPRPRWVAAACGALLAAFAGFSVAGSHDYLSWNRARWRALDELARRQVAPARVDGGFEFNGWHGYDAALPVAPSTNDAVRSWWWVKDDEYVLAFGPLAAYEEVARHAFGRWCPPGRAYVLTLRRRSER